MRRFFRWLSLISILIAGIFCLIVPARDTQAQIEGDSVLVVGTVFDTQNQPIADVQVNLNNPGGDKVISETTTQPDGSYVLPVRRQIPPVLSLQFERAHFQNTTVQLDSSQMKQLQAGETVAMPEVELERHINSAFWISAAIFILVLALIATGVVHNTLAALLGTALIFAFSYLGAAIRPGFFIFTFRGALGYVDWNVIFLIMGMMIVIAAVERTGIFQWLAFFAYRASGGRTWLLVAILMLATGIASAFLDNVTTMLLMTPMTIQIAMAMGINPLALLMPEVFASNVVGISTLVGTPTNILIGSFAVISFNDFLKNLTPGVLLALLGLILYSEWIYRKDLQTVGEVSPELLERLEERAQITQPDHLKKAGWVGAGMLILFVTGEHFNLLPSVTALLGATALLIWMQPDINEMIESVDWTTLVFFITLFIVVGSIQEVGLISLIATLIGRVFGQNLVLTILAIIWLSAILSTVVANIPFTAAMLPVISFLTASMPAASSKVLYYSLSIGSAMGGNGSLIGASANMVTAGISERAGHTITYAYFLRKGFPALLITVALATIWILIRFL
ncbi:MAG TPA: SLC13 family permease [Anaerolineales bacterium]|jgi:Na+/H+ antiporter NhaD/arsenite permease-like protein|nr:SLC13 family permease [Anaerolineales bacterium]